MVGMPYSSMKAFVPDEKLNVHASFSPLYWWALDVFIFESILALVSYYVDIFCVPEVMKKEILDSGFFCSTAFYIAIWTVSHIQGGVFFGILRKAIFLAGGNS